MCRIIKQRSSPAWTRTLISMYWQLCNCSLSDFINKHGSTINHIHYGNTWRNCNELRTHMKKTLHFRCCEKANLAKKCHELHKDEIENVTFPSFLRTVFVKWLNIILTLRGWNHILPNITHLCASACWREEEKESSRKSIHLMLVFMCLDMRSLTFSLGFTATSSDTKRAATNVGFFCCSNSEKN